MKKPVKYDKEAKHYSITITEMWNDQKKMRSELDSLRSAYNQLVDKEINAVLNEPKPTPHLDWAAELKKFIPLAKALNENPRVIYDDDPKGQFCVIGDTAKSGFSGHIGRTWKGTQEQAEQHAASLHRNNPGCPELLVVQVVSKVGRKEPDIKVTRV